MSSVDEFETGRRTVVDFNDEFEYADNLAEELLGKHEGKPLYAETPHGTYRFIVQAVEPHTQDGEDIVIMRLVEVKK
jgi:hypothetical protein